MQSIRLKQERQGRGWTQAYVAEQIGITKSAVNSIENGKRKPSYEILVKLEDLFCLSHRELLTYSIPQMESNVKFKKDSVPAGTDTLSNKER